MTGPTPIPSPPPGGLGIVSDTHGWFDPALRHAFASCERIVHGGDIGTREVLESFQALAPVEAVRGNIDGAPLRDLPLVARFTWRGRRVVVLHIAGSPVRPRPHALALIRRERPHVFVCGHSHIPAAEHVEGTLWINPGAAGRQGFHRERHAGLLYEKSDGALGYLRVELGPRIGYVPA